jgi:hypothetical protein
MVLFAVLVMVPAAELKAVSNGAVLAGNILGTGITTVIRGLLQGNIKSFKDVSKCLVYGSAAGLGFYQSKTMVGKGNIFPGILLANLSASVVDNVTSGEGPLSYLGFSLPLVRIEIATPLARHKRSLLRVTVSPRDAISLALSLSKSDRVSLRNGMLAFESDTPLAENVLGWAYSIFPTMISGTDESVYNHEMVHVVQSLQLMAASPEPFLKSYQREKGKAKFITFGGIRAQALGLVNDLTLAKFQSYSNYWKEIEAYHFASPVTK